jgi:CrcB protein
MRFFLICVAGGLGTGARYLLSGFVTASCGATFPYGTLAVNIIGSFLIGIVLSLSLSSEWLTPTTRLVLATGFLGGFTTYSSFNYETLRYFQDGQAGRGVLNVLLMLMSCLAAGLLGLALAKRF